MVIPAAMRQLNEPHASLSEPSSQQAITSEGSGRARRLAVELEDTVWLLRQVCQLGHRNLHLGGELVLLDSVVNFRVTELVLGGLIQRRETVQEPTTVRGFDAFRIG